MNNTPHNRLRHHVTGAIERGEAQAIVEIPALHTRSPWNVSLYNNVTSRNGTIAKIEQMPGNDEAERKANARLISAAPDLLQVAKDYVLLCQLHGMEGAVLDSALSAIAKAEGRAK